ncbi:unnamed protein product [Strongylus vulgaris]|uniref:Uncharacterized protein n=1 Tax=Strongylus vulgaris TaxID=40348 RepID=A0A3P7L2X0_STRVU|nr:unnamed protein product [Strongylus vulgaris]
MKSEMQTTCSPQSSPKDRGTKPQSLPVLEVTPERKGVPLGQSFRLKPQYRGRLRETDSDVNLRSPSPAPGTAESHGHGRLLRRRLSRSVEDVQDHDPYREKGAADIKRLLNIRREKADLQKETTKQIQKLTFMISDIMTSGNSNQQTDTEVRVCCIIQVRKPYCVK